MLIVFFFFIDSLQSRLGTLHAQLADIRLKKQTHENNIANIEHTQLRERFQLKLESLISEELQKMQEVNNLLIIIGINFFFFFFN